MLITCKYSPLFLDLNGDPPPHISYISGRQTHPSRSKTKTFGSGDEELDELEAMTNCKIWYSNYVIRNLFHFSHFKILTRLGKWDRCFKRLKTPLINDARKLKLVLQNLQFELESNFKKWPDSHSPKAQKIDPKCLGLGPNCIDQLHPAAEEISCMMMLMRGCVRSGSSFRLESCNPGQKKEFF